ncbi:hypothetical protein BP6252_07991 [Coleophoma cylindrospora]|uniref:NTF2-like protein n=1 Tax=Coleophoma cylindrospora TaxID=1849047 RepID=A0A3D8RBY7_9HELO|nr:hypothetical protein BP6252_07991 [Coleophoma cylindrospora]
MALQGAYKQFLAAPSPALLAEDASLNYITTLVTLSGSAQIVKHLGAQNSQLKKTEEIFLDVVEGPNSIAAEVHTTMEFLTSGSSYLPGLDDNFLADRIVTFPIIHIVQFDAAGKIQQIRQSWDQGSLLKLIDVIGKSGRNWPIRDGKDQIKLISSIVASGGKPVDGAVKEERPVNSRENSKNITRDPHASLSLFAPREDHEDPSLPAVVAPRASVKPTQRDLSDLLGSHEGDIPRATSSNTSKSPDKPEHMQNYLPSRLFDNDENSPMPSPAAKSNERFYRPNPTKFQHFDFGEGEDVPESKPAAKATKGKHSSHWDFEDFNTPAKAVPTRVLNNRPAEVRNWGNSDDEVVDSPVKVKKANKPRKDAQTHFEFQDDGMPDEPRLIGRPRGAGQNTGLGLYQNNLYGDEENAEAPAPESNKTTGLANVKDRRKDFDAHFTMTDDVPTDLPKAAPLGQDRAKAVKMMDSNWASYDESPNQKENFSEATNTSRPATANAKGPLSEVTKGINIAGDGMGSRKGAAAVASPKQKGINIGGDGMGGRKGTGRNWGFGDESEGEEQPAYRTGKAQRKQPTNDFWDF